MALRVVFLLYCLEAGVFFVLLPWTRFWLTHPLLNYNEPISAFATNAYLRGFVSGFGLLHILVGLRELVVVLQNRRASRTQTR